jgi:hypothetical protein
MQNELIIDGHNERERDLSESTSAAVGHAVGLLACNELIVMHNKTVFAVVANANSPTMLEDVRNLKLDGERKALGWAVPFEKAMPLIDAGGFRGRKLKGLFSDRSASELTARAGALCFVRSPAQKWALRDRSIPRGLISYEEGTVQPYSPRGQDSATYFVDRARARGVELGLTSLNYHSEAEIVSSSQAKQFAAEAARPLYVLEDNEPRTGQKVVLGSYPIVTAWSTHLEISREGCIASELIADCFDGYEVDVTPPGQQAAKYRQQLRREDLPEQYQNLKGPRMRMGILATLGWSRDAKRILDARLGLST